MLASTILVPTDLSERSLAAVRYAAALATRLGAEMILTINVNLPERAALEEVAAAGEAAVPDTARRVLREIGVAEAPGVTVSVDVRERDFPAEGILAAIDETNAELVVVGSHGRGGLTRLLLGSVAEKIVRSSPVPVLVVPVRDG